METDNSSYPLVSVVVATYNSAATVIETLDSIYNQSYRNIELIISDDGSMDNTVVLCKEWLFNHRERFISTKLMVSRENRGISSNFNKGLREATGVWVKPIAADDRLLSDCIDKLINNIKKNTYQKIVFAKVVGFGNLDAAEKWPLKNVKWLFDNLSFKEMKILLTQANFLPAASAIINKEVFEEIGYYDETIPLLEDWPFWVKAVFHNIQLSFFDDYVAEYRFSEDSISMGTMKCSSPYKESLEMAVRFAQAHLSQVSILMNFFCWSMRLKYSGSTIGKFIYFLNILNPEYYRLKRVKNKFSYFYSHT